MKGTNATNNARGFLHVNLFIDGHTETGKKKGNERKKSRKKDIQAMLMRGRGHFSKINNVIKRPKLIEKIYINSFLLKLNFASLCEILNAV